MKPKLDALNIELSRVLDALLASDTDITVREVSRNHATLHNASAFTRNPKRMEMISNAQARQKQLRSALNPHFVQSKSLSDKLTQAEDANAMLGTQVAALIASHAACIQAVMKAGGLNALERFWKEYKAIGETVRPAGMSSERAEVIPLKTPSRRSTRPKST
ncbi:hypothetical protein [Massilia putida]|uniref:hypothetical protein n=1 Tax=Massilia putida TaxID=1141883 RepID=UPI0012EC6D46|nr:hypothetical protein [Massilia putida]